MSLGKIALSLFGSSIVLVLLLLYGRDYKSLSTQDLRIIEKPDRVVIEWNGPVQEPMRARIANALGRYRTDKRRLILSLHSPGGFVEHGREVANVIQGASNARKIETFIDKGGVCASMCVPIYLAGVNRIADPGARFMFHEAKLAIPESVKKASETKMIVKSYERGATDDMFLSDFDMPRINREWRISMRHKIVDADVWLTARELMAQDSGVVDKLVFASN